MPGVIIPIDKLLMCDNVMSQCHERMLCQQSQRIPRARPDLRSSIMGLWTPDRDYNISDNTHVNTLTMEQLAFLLLPFCK